MSDDLKLAEHTIDTAFALIDRLQVENQQLRAENERLRNEKVAGVAAIEAAGAGLSPASGQAPATDPAPAVCEWTDSGGMLWATNCGQSYGAFVSRFGKDAYCPHCDKIIKFSWRPRNE